MSALSQSLLFKPSTNNASTGTVAVVYPNTATGTLVYNSVPVKANGYFSNGGGLHTVMYALTSEFIGTITMQATLASEPAESDWFSLSETDALYPNLAFRPETSVNLRNFEGNYVWVRGSIMIDQGSVLMVQYNH
jgi:hypothetical protein